MSDETFVAQRIDQLQSAGWGISPPRDSEAWSWQAWIVGELQDSKHGMTTGGEADARERAIAGYDALMAAARARAS